MNRRNLGSTSLSVNEIGYGAMHLSIDRERRPSEAEAVKLLQRGIDELHVDFIDTADAYCIDASEVGHNERLIAEALKEGRREKVLVATKGGSTRPEGRWERNGRPEYLRTACERSLKALEVDHIDLYQLHAPDPEVPVEESVGALADMQREGKIRHIGVSNFTLDQMKRIRDEARIVSLQNRYSVMSRRDQEPIIEYCEQEQITYLPWNPVGGRGNAPKIGEMYEVLDEIAAAHDSSPHAVVLAWLLQHSPVIIPIPGTTKFEHLKENMGAADLELSREEIERLDGLDAPESIST